MSSKDKEVYEAIQNPVYVDANDDSVKLDLIHPEITILQYKRSAFHIYRACYLKRLRGSSNKLECVVKSSLCPDRSKIIAGIIRLAPKESEDSIRSILNVFDWLDDNSRGELIYLEKDALETYRLFSESLFREARGSAVKGKRRQRTALRKLQNSMALLLSISSGWNVDRLIRSAIRIETFGLNKNYQKRLANEAEMQNFWTLNLRHFQAISSFLLTKEDPPLIVSRVDIGYPDYKRWTFGLDSIVLEKAKINNTYTAQFFDENDEFIFDERAVKSRAKELGQDRFKGPKYRDQLLKITDGDSRFRESLFRWAGIHFSHLLLMASGCNAEQLEYLNFAKKLSSTTDAKRQVAIKPRASYEEKPVQFSAKFLPIWRTYLKLRELTIETYQPDFGDFGIPIVVKEAGRRKSDNPLCQASSISINIRSPEGAGFPSDTKIPLTKSARDFKTTNFLELTSGDIGLTSKAMGRSEKVTRKNYAFKAFEDSAKELTTFFDALAQAASIKAQGYSPAAPISEKGARIHTGSCDAKNEPPKKIEGVTELAPDPRCGAPVTCFFCEHFGHHADVHDIKLMLSAKAWLQRRTTEISRNIDEHMAKFFPIIERIDDIVDDFRKQSNEYNLIYKTAMSDIEAGNYSPYWRNKIDAFISAMER